MPFPGSRGNALGRRSAQATPVWELKLRQWVVYTLFRFFPDCTRALFPGPSIIGPVPWPLLWPHRGSVVARIMEVFRQISAVAHRNSTEAIPIDQFSDAESQGKISKAKSMSHLDDVIDDALREHNISQMGSAGSARVGDALRSLLAPHHTPAAEPAALQDLLSHFQQGGFEEVFRSWMGPGSNEPIEPDQLGHVLGDKSVHELSDQTGMPPQALLDELACLLPTVIDRLTPQGSLPEFKAPQPGSRA